MPRQMALPQHAEQLARDGRRARRRRDLADPLAAPLDAVVVARRLHRLVRVARGPDHHQPPLRAGRAADQLDPREQPRRERLPGEDPRRREAGRSGPAASTSPRRSPTSPRRSPTASTPSPIPSKRTQGDREAREGAGRRLREGPPRHPLRRRRASSAAPSTSSSSTSRSATSAWSTCRARSIGNYGGEIDNWAWPRHTGDFSFYRAYVGKDGKPADPSPDNVPFKPKHCLKVDRRPLTEQRLRDGRRLSGHDQPRHHLRRGRSSTSTWTYPTTIEQLQERYDVLERCCSKQGGADRDQGRRGQAGRAERPREEPGRARRPQAGRHARQQEGARRQGPGVGGAARPRGRTPTAIDALDADRSSRARKTARGRLRLAAAPLSGSAPPAATRVLLVRMAEERHQAGRRAQARLPGARPAAPRARAEAVRAPVRPDHRPRAASGSRWCARSRCPRPTGRGSRIIVGAKKGAGHRRGAIDKAARRLLQGHQARRREGAPRPADEGHHRAAEGVEGSVHQAGGRAVADGARREETATTPRRRAACCWRRSTPRRCARRSTASLSPDANSHPAHHLRHGQAVRAAAASRSPWSRDPRPRTRARSRSTRPRAARGDQGQDTGARTPTPTLGEVPVDFLSDLDITGGNSGSPTLNAKGELIGLAFDGNIEGVASDVVFNPPTTRTILVDIRYVLWVMDLARRRRPPARRDGRQAVALAIRHATPSARARRRRNAHRRRRTGSGGRGGRRRRRWCPSRRTDRPRGRRAATRRGRALDQRLGLLGRRARSSRACRCRAPGSRGRRAAWRRAGWAASVSRRTPPPYCDVHRLHPLGVAGGVGVVRDADRVDVDAAALGRRAGGGCSRASGPSRGRGWPCCGSTRPASGSRRSAWPSAP